MLIGNFPRNIPLATHISNGLMSSQDKKHLDSFKDKVNLAGDIVGKKVYIFLSEEELKSATNLNENEIVYILDLKEQCLKIYLISADPTPIVFDDAHLNIGLDYSEDEHGQAMYAKFVVEVWNDINLVIDAMNSGCTGEYYFNWKEKPDGSIMITGLDKINNEIVLDNVIVPSIIDKKLVTEIGDRAFKGYECRYLSIPDTVTNLGNGCFSDMPKLKILRLSNKIKVIPDDMCFLSTVENIDIPNNTMSIGNRAFSQSGLKKIVIPTSVSNIGKSCFKDCRFLKSVDILSNDIVIRNYAFADCPVLENIHISEGAILEDNVFTNSGLFDINIPENCTVGSCCFSDMERLKNITFGKSVKFESEIDDTSSYIPEYHVLFNNQFKNKENSVIVYANSSMKKLSEKDKKFGGTYYTKLKQEYFQDLGNRETRDQYIRRIGTTVFDKHNDYFEYDRNMLEMTTDLEPVVGKTYYTINNIRVKCNNLKEFDGIRTYYEFVGNFEPVSYHRPIPGRKYYIILNYNDNDPTNDICIEYTDLQSFTDGITYYEYVGDFVVTEDREPSFNKTYYILETDVLIAHLTETSPESLIHGILTKFEEHETYYEYPVPYEKTIMYRIIEDYYHSTNYILYNNLSNDDKQTVNITDGNIGCSYVYLKESIENKDIFSIDRIQCGTNNTEVVLRIYLELPGKLKHIKSCAFFDSSDLYKVLLPQTLLTIEDFAFKNSGLEYINIPDSVEDIGEGAFAFSNIHSLDIPNGMSIIRKELCYACSKLSSLNISNTVKHIQSKAFAMTNIKRLYIPYSVQDILSEAFANSSIVELNLTDGLILIGKGAFKNTLIHSVKIPSTVQFLCSYAFQCKNLSSVIILSNASVGIVDDYSPIYNSDDNVELEESIIDYRFMTKKYKVRDLISGMKPLLYFSREYKYNKYTTEKNFIDTNGLLRETLYGFRIQYKDNSENVLVVTPRNSSYVYDEPFEVNSSECSFLDEYLETLEDVTVYTSTETLRRSWIEEFSKHPTYWRYKEFIHEYDPSSEVQEQEYGAYSTFYYCTDVSSMIIPDIPLSIPPKETLFIKKYISPELASDLLDSLRLCSLSYGTDIKSDIKKFFKELIYRD